MFRTLATLAAVLAVSATSASAQTDDVAEFYRGKTVRLIIGYGPGGGYDVYAKLFARFLGEQIPGKPTVIAQNMPGAGSRSAANWLYKVAPKDGTRPRRAQPGNAGRPGARPARHPVRRAEFQLDRQHGGGQQHHDHLGRVGRAHHRRREEAHACDRRHRRELAIGALSDGRQQSVRHAVQDRVRLSRRRRHHDRARAARGGWSRQQLLGVAEGQQSRAGSRRARSTSCSRSARTAKRTCPARRS